ncbi:MAG: aminotransferase class I/II-fold pyridoxal phosphate-dependent enzyme [Chloroflexi bacterium]|nr:aminotransferase class I/II-fold pyridoxal phosphate-dependent enzyme [Chloroflexota bacterium]
MRIAKRMDNIPPYIFAAVSKKIAVKRAEGMDVINLGIGSPDLTPPQFIVDALKGAADEAISHRYPSYFGLPELRQAVADWYAGRFDVTLDPAREVLPLIGSKEGIAHMAQVLIDPGDVALVPDPGYPTYSKGTLLANGEVYYMPLQKENGFMPDLDAIPEDVRRRARCIWVNYPNNPTGAIAPLSFFEELIVFAQENDIAVMADNPYSDVTYDGYVAPSFLQVEGAREVGVEFHSLSKTYNMAGWRVGMVVGNETIIEALTRVKSNVDTGIFRPVQIGAIAALTGDQSWLVERNATYQERRDVVMAGLEAAGISATSPKATLYVWPETPAGYTSEEFSMKVLNEAGVWITPGNAFGPSGEGFLRISLCTTADRLREAMERINNLDWK